MPPPGGLAVAPGAQSTFRLLVAVQAEEPAFLLVRVDGPARTVTLCGLPGGTAVAAPTGETTLAACYLAAGPARAAQLLGDTLGYRPDAYFAATADGFAALAGEDAAARLDLSALLDAGQRRALGCGSDPVAALTAQTAEPFVQSAARAGLSDAALAELRAAAWAAFLRQNPALLSSLPGAARRLSGRTLTDLDAKRLLKLENTMTYLAGQTATAVEYTGMPGTGGPATAEYALGAQSRDAIRALLG